MDEKEKIIDLLKHKELKENIEFEEVKKFIICSIFDNIVPTLFNHYPMFKNELSEEQYFALKADICGSAVGYMMGSLDKFKEEFRIDPTSLTQYLEGILEEIKK